MLGKQRREVAALAARVAYARERGAMAAADIRRARSRVLARPAMLLLPFAAGLLGSALATRRGAVDRGAGVQPAPVERERRRERIAWTSLASSAVTLWNTTRPLRESLQDPATRQALAEAFGHRPGASTSTPPAGVAKRSTGRPSSVQRAPPA